MRKKHFTKEEKKQARKKWNKAYYERRKILIETAKRIIAEQEKKQAITL